MINDLPFWSIVRRFSFGKTHRWLTAAADAKVCIQSYPYARLDNLKRPDLPYRFFDSIIFLDPTR